jgi:uncharacterized protein
VDVILFFVKNPEPGQVKTRLGATIGHEQAAAAYRRIVEAICAMLPSGVRILVAFDPPDKQEVVQKWLSPLLGSRASYIPQGNGDLGNRLVTSFEAAFHHGSRVAVIGSDCIDLTKSIWDQTWRSLEQHDCVIGPSADGGYYLMALKKPCPELFQSIPWSTESTLQVTLQRAAETGLTVHLLPVLEDIDTEKDWKRASQKLASPRAVH